MTATAYIAEFLDVNRHLRGVKSSQVESVTVVRGMTSSGTMLSESLHMVRLNKVSLL
jgi:hypothetical protein